MSEPPQYFLVTSNYSPAWAEDSGGEEFGFVWKLYRNPNGNNEREIQRNGEIFLMVRRWCQIEPISEAWAETLAIKLKCFEMIDNMDDAHKFLKMKGCHIV